VLERPVTEPVLATPTTIVRVLSDDEVRATVATTPNNIDDLSLPVFVNNELPKPEAQAPLVIQTENDVTVQVVTINDAVVTVSDESGFRLAVAAVDEAGEPVKVSADGALVVTRRELFSIVGSGLRPDSTVVAWLFSEPRRLGSVQVAPDGTFSERFAVPEGLPVGDHTAQVNGIDADGGVRSFNLAVELRADTAALVRSADPVTSIHADPADASIMRAAAPERRDDSRAAFLLLAALLLGGAIFFVNGMRLKNRDISNGIIRPAYIRDGSLPNARARQASSRRVTSTPQRRAARPHVRASDDTGEIFIG
jgi:hypothetical protein